MTDTSLLNAAIAKNRNYQERTSKSVRTYIRWILAKN